MGTEANTIVQWNCRGLKANYTDIDALFQILSPAVVCLQETLQSDQNVTNLRNYTQFYKNAMKRDGRPSGGVSILIRKCIPHSQISLVTNLQATAARITLHKAITICSLYLPPNTPLDLNELFDLVTQLTSPILLLGDFNAHSPLCGGSALDNRGKIIEDFINKSNLCLLNKKSATCIHPATGSQTSINLSICDPSLVLDLSWTVHDDLCSSDHYPLIIKSNKPIPLSLPSRWKLLKADWSTFQELCEENLNQSNFNVADDATTRFTAQLLENA